MLLVFLQENRLKVGWLLSSLLPGMLLATLVAPLPGQVRLLGIVVDTSRSVSLVKIDSADGSHEFLASLTSVNQRHALAFNPEDGLAYHTAGGNSLHSSPDHEPERLEPILDVIVRSLIHGQGEGHCRSCQLRDSLWPRRPGPACSRGRGRAAHSSRDTAHRR